MLNFLPKLLQNESWILQQSFVRHKHRMLGISPELGKSLKQRLDEIKAKNPMLFFQVDIGLPPPERSRKERMQIMKQINERRKDPNLEKQARNLTLDISTDDVRSEWLKTGAPKEIQTVAEHYNIYADLFGGAYFTPYVILDIGFPQDSGLQAPVHRGNTIKPKEASKQPFVKFKSAPEDLWSLVLTGPDGHFTETDKEYVHWFVGNIPGGDVTKGETLWDYMQPFPVRGIGYQRFIFVLYKQNKLINYSSIKKELPCLELKDRTFKTLEFYRERQEELTPAGLAFFQSDWDISVKHFMYEELNMEEPIFEYDHEPPYVKPQVWFPTGEPFNRYLDRYRDPRDISKDFLLRKLKKFEPFEKPKKPFPYPSIHPPDRKEPSWLTIEKNYTKLGRGRIVRQIDDDYDE